MSGSGRDRHLVAAFSIGVAIIPAFIGLVWALLALWSPEPCSQGELCFRGLVESLVSGIVVSLVAGFVAQHLARDATGWLAMMVGLTAAAVIVAAITGATSADFGGAVMLLGCPATVGYAVLGGLSELVRGAPDRPARAGGAIEPAAVAGRDRGDRFDSLFLPIVLAVIALVGLWGRHSRWPSSRRPTCRVETPSWQRGGSRSSWWARP